MIFAKPGKIIIRTEFLKNQEVVTQIILVPEQSSSSLKHPIFKLSGKETRFQSLVYEEILEYLLGKRKEFSFPVFLRGTLFQKKVWEEVRKIPYGETRTYGFLAERLETSPRAIGQALKKNPLPIYIPCHRVVGKNSLGGFSAGLSWKTFLLQREKF